MIEAGERLHRALDADFYAAGCVLREEMNGQVLTAAQMQRVIAMGVPAAMVGRLTACHDLVAARVDLHRDSTFHFGGPDGRLVMAVRDTGGAIIDLVAMSFSDENKWALRTGTADLLGEWNYYHAIATQQRVVRLHSTPLAWLRAAGDGICVLDWTRSALTMLRSLGARTTLDCDAGAGARLKGLLKYGDLPLVREIAPQRAEYCVREAQEAA